MASDDRPHVVWVNHYAVSPREGGGTRHFELGRELVRRGYQVTIIASDFTLHTRQYSRRACDGDRAGVLETIDGVRFWWLWAAPYHRNDWRRIWNWLSFAWRVARCRPAGPRPAVVIGSSPDLFAAWGAARLATRVGAPFVLEVRDLWPESLLAGGGRPGLGYRALERLAGMLYRRARLVVTLTEGVARYLRDRGVGPVCCAPNGVDLAAFDGAPTRAGRGTTVVYLGAHGHLNGLDLVLDAAAAVRDRPEVTIRLIGDGPEKAALVARARAEGLTNVRFDPPVPKSAVPEVLRTADVGLMVLREAPLFAFGVSPNKLFDYLGAGLPVITNVPGEVAEMVTTAGAGEVVPPGSGQALAAAIRRMADLPAEERAALGAAGRRWVAERHARDVVAGDLVAALEPVVVHG